MANQITLDTPIARAENNLSSNLAGEEVVLNLLDGVYYGLNDVGARVWALLDSANTPREICDALQEEYDVERDALEDDVLSLLADMTEEGLVERRSPVDTEEA